MTTTSKNKQRGITLLESLIALLISALGVLGILGIQMRTLIDTHGSARRAQAMRLIDDLSERAKMNPNALANRSSYISDWESTQEPKVKCDAQACSADQLAEWDVWQWKNNVSTILPMGDAKVFDASDESSASTKRQLGVMVSWRNSERGDAESDYTDAFTKLAPNADCPSGKICHIQYLQLTSRCTPYALGGSDNMIFCPAGMSDK
ncbi:MAG: type IV pilus modification protein PilV [Burkholderiaceae bacterium]|nr:type IV pilus modification protein PilV [Burkholderiaceae bacterium]